MKRSRLHTLEGIVAKVLEDNPKARDDDGYCYIKVASELLGRDVSRDPLIDVLVYGKDFPKTESVRRTRQKVQHNNPHLRSSKEVAKWRAEQEREFRKYSHS